MKRFLWIVLFLVYFLATEVECWDAEELELFDIVEEVNQNFYDVLGIEQSASSAEVRKAYRKLSVKLHPDKNKEEDAEEKFRQLVAVYEVLKDESKRTRYNEILVNGLPDWRQPVFYYRRVRKLGLLELALLLTVILTVGHGLVIWAIYIERRFELEEVFKSRRKKEKRGKKAKLVSEREDEILEEELSTIPRPKWTDILPIKMMAFNFYLVVSIPGWLRDMKESWDSRNVVEDSEGEENEEDNVKKARRRQRVDIPDITPEMAQDVAPVMYTNVVADHQEEARERVRSGQEWTDDEISLLAKAVAKFPSGMQGRWEKIAEMIGRSVSEVVAKSKQIKQGYAISVDPKAQGTTGALTERVKFKKGKSIGDSQISQRSDWVIDNHQESTTGAEPHGDSASKVKNKLLVEQKGSADNDTSVWTQNQQKILEWALAHFPKGTPERWEKIAEHIPGKSKEDCMARFKYLAEIVRRKKQEVQKAS